MNTEVLYEVTQTGTDLTNIETRIEVKGRFYVKKSLGILHGMIMRGAEPQLKEKNANSFTGMAEKVKRSFDEKMRTLGHRAPIQ
jgi:hypothetical protein